MELLYQIVFVAFASLAYAVSFPFKVLLGGF